MEICDLSLDDFDKDTNNPDMTIDDLRHVATGVLGGLVHLHDHKVIHRDLKLKNILLKKRGEHCQKICDMVIKLCDFNISKCSPNDIDAHTPLRGSKGYRGPEVLLGQNYGMSSDIWALGILIFKLRTKGDLFPTEDEIKSEELDDIVVSKLTTGLEEELRMFLEVCLKKNPEERHTAKQLLSSEFLQRGITTISIPY